TLHAGVDQRLGLMDIAGAQMHFHRLGRLSRIDLRVRPGVDVDALARALSAVLPAGIVAARPQSTIEASARVSRAYRVNLDVLALVALFTGGLLVFSTQVLSVVRRRSQLALMRVLGLTRRELVALLVAEGAMLGVIGSAIGLALGYGLATIALRLVGADLGSGYFRGVVPHAAFGIAQAMLFAALGIGTAIAGTAAPALEAARAAPAQALKAGDEQRMFARLRSWKPALVVLALGVLATLAPPITDLPILGYASIALFLIGTLMLLPHAAALAWRHAPSSRRAPLRLALEQLRGAPGQSGVSLASMVASIALMVSMGIMVHSFRQSLQEWLERVLPADIYVRAAPSGDTGYLSPALQGAIAATPGVRRVDFIREQQLLIDPARPRIVMLARDIDPDDPDRLLVLMASRAIAAGEAPVWINEPAAAIYGWNAGDVVRLPLAGRSLPFVVAGIWRDYARQQGAVVIERSRYVASTGDRNATNAAIWIAGDASVHAVREALAQRLPGADQLDIALPEEIRHASLRAFDRTFAVTYALELAAVLIGLVGLSSAFGALVLARRREFGMLRHLGMLRRQIALMLASEGLLVSGLGMAIGLVLGWAMSLVLIHVINRQSFHWGMELSMPWLSLVVTVVLVIGLSMATAVVSGRAAMSAEAVRAVREDW
ncbi:MAG TPA: FtsX-like permease family protein, partial [Casimicrobiaceae bacterium]|nr:FtsX-like permease family protein [Casimicrobiaceae bacterium]